MNTVQLPPPAVPPNRSSFSVACTLNLPGGIHEKVISVFRYVELNLWIESIFSDLEWMSQKDFRFVPNPLTWHEEREPEQALAHLHAALEALSEAWNLVLSHHRYRGEYKRNPGRVACIHRRAQRRPRLEDFGGLQDCFDELLRDMRDFSERYLEIQPKEIMRFCVGDAQMEHVQEYREWMKWVWEAATGETLSFE